MNNSYKILLTLMFCITAITSAFAVGPPGPPATPIDGGLGLLLAGGAVYGIKKVRELKKSGDG